MSDRGHLSRTERSGFEDPIRHFRVRVVSSGYATVQGRTKAEAVRNARAGDFIGTPRPDWSAQISDIREVSR